LASRNLAPPAPFRASTAKNGALTKTGPGTITLRASSTLSLGADNNQFLIFNDYDHTGGLLTINDWDGAIYSAGTGGRILFHASSASFSSDELNNIQFSGFSAGATLIACNGSFNELVPVPEPSSVFVGLALFGLAGWRERRREQQARRATR
jgi:hypothetical protein